MTCTFTTPQISAAEVAVAKSAASVTEAEAKVTKLRSEYDEAKAALAAGRAALAEADNAVKALSASRDAALAEAETAVAEAAKAEARSKAAAKDAGSAERLAADLLAKHPWIEGERQFFGRAHTDYDFAARDVKEAGAALTALEKTQAELEKGINKKVVGMIETAEREYGDLISKKRIIENDKAKIEVRWDTGRVLWNEAPVRAMCRAESDQRTRREEERGAQDHVGQGQCRLWVHLFDDATGRHCEARPP